MSRWVEIDTALLKTVSAGGLSAKALWKRIMQQPSIDICFCRECKHRGICLGKLVQGIEVVQLNFCSYGEREGE